jgi:hypothetical protein
VIAVIGFLMIFEAPEALQAYPYNPVRDISGFRRVRPVRQHFPGSFKIVSLFHDRIPIRFFIPKIGIFGSVLNISATFIFLLSFSGLF